MKKLPFVLVIGLITFCVQAQGIGAFTYLESKNIDIQQQQEFSNLTEDEFNDIQGSPYANQTFLNGSVYQNDKLVSKNLFLRYNAYSDEVEIKTGDSDDAYDAMLKNPETFAKIGIDVYIFVAKNGVSSNGNYFSIVTAGDHFDLYKKTAVTYKAPYKGKTSYDSDKPGKFLQSNTYYLVSKEGIFHELPARKSKILKVMSTKEEELNGYIKSNKLDVSNEMHLSNLVDYYNSIL